MCRLCLMSRDVDGSSVFVFLNRIIGPETTSRPPPPLPLLRLPDTSKHSSQKNNRVEGAPGTSKSVPRLHTASAHLYSLGTRSSWTPSGAIHDGCCMLILLMHALNYASKLADAHTEYVVGLLLDVYIFLTVYFSKCQHQRACRGIVY